MITRTLKAVVLGLALAALLPGCGVSGDPKSLIAKAQGLRQEKNYKAAIIELKNALQKDSNNAEARYLLGITYYDNLDYRMAEQELRRALELSYERSKVMPALGKAMLMLEVYQKVLDQIPVEGHASDTVQANILTLRARALIGLNRTSQAQELLRAALAKQPEFADALVEQARIAAGERQIEETVSLVERALRSAPKHVDGLLIKGDLARARSDQTAAMEAFQKVVEVDPHNIPARLRIASLHIENNKASEAKKIISEIRRISPGNVMASHMQALVDFRAGEYVAANENIQRVLKTVPDYLPSILLAGAILTEMRSYEQARSHLARVLARAPGNIYARRLLATTFARTGQLERAIEVLQPALKQAPDEIPLLSLAGEIHLQRGEFGKAADYFDKASKGDPKNALTRSKLGLSRMASGDADRGLADLELAVTIDEKKSQTGLVLILTHFRLKNFDQALKAAELLEKKQPDSAVVSNLKAVIYLAKRDVPNARKAFQRALEIQPAFFAATRNLAQLDLDEKNPKAARRRIEALLEKDKNNALALIALAELGTALGATPKERVDWLERARGADPKAMQPLLMLPSLYVQMGERRKALEIAQQAQAANPENPQFLDLLGFAQLSAGEKGRALVTYRAMVKLQPKSPYGLYRLADAQAGVGDFGAAAESLRQALAFKPGYTDASVALVSLEIRAKRYPAALSVARQVQKQSPKSYYGLSLEGDVLMAERKFPLAIKAYESAQSIYKTSATLVRLYAAHVAAGRSEDGDALLEQGIKESPEDVTVRLYAAEVAVKRGDHKRAISQYEWLSQKQPENIVLLNNLAWAYFQAKDARALEVAERAYKLAPENAPVLDTLGTLLVEHGEVARGTELLGKAVKVAPNVAEFHYHFAQGLIKAGDKLKARDALERALAFGGTFAGYSDAKNLLSQLRK